MTTRKYLTIQRLLKANDLVTEDVHTPEWADDGAEWVQVRGMTGRQRDEFESSLVKRKGNKVESDMANMRAKLVAACFVDPEGTKTAGVESVILALGAKSAAALDRVFAVCQRLSGLTQADVEELGKKSAPDLNGCLPSTSASSLESNTPTDSLNA